MSFHTNSNITASILMTRNSSGFGASVGFDAIPKVSGDRLHTLNLPNRRSISVDRSSKTDDLDFSDRDSTEARSPLSFSRRKDCLASQIILEADCCGELSLAAYLFESYLQVTPR
jgi:hypothetical protein